MKHRPYPFPVPEELVYTDGPVAVYYAKQLGRYYLTKYGFELGFKNAYHDENCTNEPDYAKWYKSWQKNAVKQLHKLSHRIDDLQAEQQEILNLIDNQE